VPEVTDVPRQDETAPAAGQVEPAGLIGRLRQRVQTALPKGSLRARFAHGAFWSIAGAAGSQALTMAAQVIAARFLGLDGYGALGLITSTVAMCGTIAGLGLGMATTKFVAEFRRTAPERAGRIVGLSSLVAVISASFVAGIVVCLAPLIAEVAMSAPDLAAQVRIAALVIFFNAINGAQLGVLSGLERFAAVARVSILGALALLPSMAAGVAALGLAGAVLGQAVASAVACVGGAAIVRHECRSARIPIRYRQTSAEWRILWRFALPMVATGLLFSPVEWVLNALLAKQPDGYASLGVLNVARQWYAIIVYLPSVLQRSSLPIMANLWGEKRVRQYRRFLLTTSALLAACSLAGAVPLVFGSRWAMALYGPEFAAGAMVLVVMALRTLVAGPNMIVGNAIWSTGDARSGFYLAVFRAAALVALFLAFLDLGALGFVLAYALSDAALFGVQVLFMYIKVRRMVAVSVFAGEEE
jgi:O-antigen/teichoic acid export membrane protein